jgi:hypothetical protein
MANRIDTDRDRPYILENGGHEIEAKMIEKWRLGRFAMLSFRCGASQCKRVGPQTTLNVARPGNTRRPMGRVKIVRVLPYGGKSLLLDCRVLKTK